MTKQKGRPRSARLLEALRRVAAGETAYKVARELGMRESHLYTAVRKERERAAQSSEPPEAESVPN